MILGGLMSATAHNYWTGEKMVEHTIRAAIPIFEYAFPNCEVLFAFDNSSNHAAVAADASEKKIRGRLVFCLVIRIILRCRARGCPWSLRR